MSDRAHRIERALSERLRRDRPGIVHVAEPTAPLSHVQQSLWILSRLARDPQAAHRPLSLALRGPLDMDALRSALTAIVRRHAVLRTTFPAVGPEPVQRIGPPAEVDLPVADVSDAPDPAASAQAVADRHFRRPFALETDPPFRPLLIRCGGDHHVLAISLHHIAFDGWSERIFVNELVALYDAAVEGRGTPDLPDLPIDFADYARWERQHVDDARIEADLAYWRERLADLPPDLDLLPDRGIVPDPFPIPVTVGVSADLTARLERLATSEGCTLFMVLLAALQVLVARHSGQDDFAIGVPTASRPLRETESLIGCFINTVAIRADLAGNPPFTTVLGSTRIATLEALDHAQAPFGRVFGELRPWSEQRLPLFRVQFQLRNFPEPFRRSRHLEISVGDPTLPGGNHLAVRATRGPDGITLHLRYDPNRFHRATIERWAGHYLTLLRGIVDDPTRGVRDHVLLSDDEYRQVIVGFNRGLPRTRVRTTLLADRLRRVASQHPEATALEDGDRAVRYRELDQMVDRVASALLDRGLGAGDRVVLYADRSLATVVGILGALRAGVPYVPVDPAVTARWLRSLVDQTRPGMILTRPHLTDDLASVEAPVGVVDRLIDGPPADPVDGRARPDDVAYVLYTSGSTGDPKGVLVEQGNLASFVDALAAAQPMGPGDRVALFHSISFDGTVTSLHAPLTTGTTVVIPRPDAFGSIPSLLRWLAEQQITILKVPTGFFHTFAEEVLAADADLPPTLRLISFGGEQVRADVIRRWLERFGDRIPVHNTYGPTETTVYVTHHAFSPADLPLDWAPVGRPVEGSAIYVLDPELRPTPIGVTGEIYVAGPQVARGYLDAPELTAQRFLEDPFCGQGRMYRTGDRGRWLPDGVLEVLGRIDRQVKVRGFRVEPEEIEIALRALDDVDDAVVVPRPSADGSTALHAYYVGSANPATVHDALRRRLPPFLVPATVTPIEALPRTVTGKLDTQRLPDPSSAARTEPSPSTTDIAEHVARVWSEVLGVDAAEPDADFFALGGHSLLAIRLMSRIHERLHCEIPLTALFEHPTLAEFTAAVEDHIGTPPSEQPPPTPQGPSADPDDVAALLAEIEQLTDEEAEALLALLEEEAP